MLNLPIRLSVNISQMFVHYLIDSGCKEDCDLITLGTYRAVDNYELNGAKDVVRCFHFWYSLCKLRQTGCSFMYFLSHCKITGQLTIWDKIVDALR